MKFGVPWSAKGIRPEARETAKEAARRSGMSLDDWLNSVVLQQAAQAGVPPYGSQPAAAQPDRREMAAVNHRLDDLSRRIEQFTRTGAPAYAPQRQPQSRGPDQRAELIGRLDQYVNNTRPQHAIPQHAMAQPRRAQPMVPGRRAPAQPGVPTPPGLDRALADIAARQQMLNGGAPPRRAAKSSPTAYAPPAARAQEAAHVAAQAQSPLPAHLPAQDLSGLEEQLRKITDQIETLRHPGVEEAINALRAELGEIGHALGEAMPQHSIETIERQIQGLSQRIAEGRQNGVDHNALGGLEHGLLEVRDALRGLTPAESLVGFNDAVAGLAQKIDLIVAQKDPETLAQLETAITTLRGMANHVASNDAVSALAAEVQSLTDKVDYIAHASTNNDVLASLEHRIDALGQALVERAQNGNAVPPRLEALVQSLSDKIEQVQQVQQTHGDDAAGHLDDRIAMLMERLDASDSRLGQLEAIERGLTDLLTHVQTQASGDAAAAAQAGEALAVDSLKYDFVQAQHALQDALKYDLAQAQDALKHDLAHSQESLKGDIARTQDALDQVHGTLGQLVDRLATIEQNFRSEARAPAPAPAAVRVEDEEPFELTQPVGRLAVRLVEDAPGMAAFDDMAPPRVAQAPAPIAPPAPPAMPTAPIAPMAPPIQPAPPIHHAPAAMAEPEPAVEAEPEHALLPPAPQLEVEVDELRKKIAAMVPQAQVQEPAPQAPPAQSWAPEAPPLKRMAAGHGPINPDLPPDQPLEPGSGPPPLRANPAARIAASEAALGHARPGEEPAPAAAGKSSFIAAARRAAQAAMQHEPKQAPPPELEDEPEETGEQPLRSRMMRRMKSLFVAASIVAIVVGSVQIAATMLHLGKSAPPSKSAQQHLSMDRRAATEPEDSANADAPQATAPAMTPAPNFAAATMALSPPMASIDLLAPPDQTVHVGAVPQPDPRRSAQTQSASADITGSIPDAAANRPPKRPARAPLAQSAGLPVEIGSQRLRQAAATGNGDAAYEVATRFAEGRGVPANLSLAARWFERAANRGLAPAQFRYASMLEKGQGVKKDLARARTLYIAAARQGNAKAMHNLAVLYAEGIDGKPDYATAVQWFRKASEHGVSDSQYNLGILYARGIGVEKNLPESYKWFALAAKHGDKEAAKKRDEVATHIDAKALAAARRAVAKFVAAPQPQPATVVPAPPGGWDKGAAPART